MEFGLSRAVQLASRSATSSSYLDMST